MNLHRYRTYFDELNRSITKEKLEEILQFIFKEEHSPERNCLIEFALAKETCFFT